MYKKPKYPIGGMLASAGVSTVGSLISGLIQKRQDEKAEEEAKNMYMESAGSIGIMKNGGMMGRIAEVEGNEVRFTPGKKGWKIKQEYKGPGHSTGGITINAEAGTKDLIGTEKDKKIYDRIKQNPMAVRKLMESIAARPVPDKLGYPNKPIYEDAGSLGNREGKWLKNLTNQYVNKFGYPMQTELPFLKNQVGTGMTGGNTSKSSMNDMDNMDDSVKPKWGTFALNAAPEVLNIATGIFGKNRNAPATKVDRTALGYMPNKYNIRPIINANASDYRGIQRSLKQTGAGPGMMQAAYANKLKANNAAYGTKENQENHMRAAIASMIANFDAQDSRYANQRAEDNMMVDANLGIGGNFARAGLSNLAGKGLGFLSETNRRRTDREGFKMLSEALAGSSGLDTRKYNPWIADLFGL